MDMGEKEDLFYILAERDIGGKYHFADRENASGKIIFQGLVLTGHSIPR